MSYIEFKFWSAVAIVVIACVAAFFYRLYTGKDIRDKFREPPPGEK